MNENVNKTKTRISVIGTGHLGSIHARLLKSNTEAEFAGIFDTDTERTEKLASEFSCTKFNSLQDAIGYSDAIIIATPTSTHHEIAMHCIAAGKHCFIEKPITHSYSEAKALIEAAMKTGVIIQVGHVERFNPAIAALSGYKLAPLFIEAHRLSQFKPRATDVSVIHDLMIHDIDIMLWLIKSKVSKIDANGVSVLTDTTDIANARITFENGSVANLTASRISANPMRKMRFFQKDAYISIDFGKPEVEIFRLLEQGTEPESKSTPTTMLGTIEAGTKNKNIYFEKPEVPKLNAIAEEHNAFIRTITEGMKVAVGASEAAEALRIAEEIEKMI